MVINQLIAIFLPSIIALKIDSCINIKNKSNNILIQNYLIYVLLVNLFSYIITVYLFKQTDIIFTYSFTIKYILLSIVLCIILPVLWIYIIKNIAFKLKVEKNEKSN